MRRGERVGCALGEVAERGSGLLAGMRITEGIALVLDHQRPHLAARRGARDGVDLDDGLARWPHALISLLLVPLAPAIEPFCDLAPLRHRWTQSPCAALRKFVVAPLSKGDAEVRGSLRSIR